MARAIPLTKGYVALVSDKDFARVSKFKWCASIESRGTKVYAVRARRKDDENHWKSKKIRMHHFVLDVAPTELNGRVVDHRNHNSLDNRRGNLKIITQRTNMLRSPGWKRRTK